jgi:hypothetical protein
MLAAHRGAADAAGIDWKSAVYRKVQEEVTASRGLTIERMVELGRLLPLLIEQGNHELRNTKGRPCAVHRF